MAKCCTPLALLRVFRFTSFYTFNFSDILMNRSYKWAYKQKWKGMCSHTNHFLFIPKSCYYWNSYTVLFIDINGNDVKLRRRCSNISLLEKTEHFELSGWTIGQKACFHFHSYLVLNKVCVFLLDPGRDIKRYQQHLFVLPSSSFPHLSLHISQIFSSSLFSSYLILLLFPLFYFLIYVQS